MKNKILFGLCIFLLFLPLASAFTQETSLVGYWDLDDRDIDITGRGNDADTNQGSYLAGISNNGVNFVNLECLLAWLV